MMGRRPVPATNEARDARLSGPRGVGSRVVAVSSSKNQRIRRSRSGATRRHGRSRILSSRSLPTPLPSSALNAARGGVPAGVLREQLRRLRVRGLELGRQQTLYARQQRYTALWIGVLSWMMSMARAVEHVRVENPLVKRTPGGFSGCSPNVMRRENTPSCAFEYQSETRFGWVSEWTGSTAHVSPRRIWWPKDAGGVVPTRGSARASRSRARSRRGSGVRGARRPRRRPGAPRVGCRGVEESKWRGTTSAKQIWGTYLPRRSRRVEEWRSTRTGYRRCVGSRCTVRRLRLDALRSTGAQHGRLLVRSPRHSSKCFSRPNRVIGQSRARSSP